MTSVKPIESSNQQTRPGTVRSMTHQTERKYQSKLMDWFSCIRT